jgi:hypothetical protein
MSGIWPMTEVARGNLIHALRLAIDVLKEEEKRMGYTGPSCVLATWQQWVEELTAGRR